MANGKCCSCVLLLPSAVCRLPRAPAVGLLIKVRFSFRSSFPALVYPKPLVRVEAHHSFNRCCEARSIELDVFLMIACPQQFDRRVAMEEVALALLVPNSARRNHHGIRLQCQGRHSRCSTSKLAKERNENPFVWLCIEI